MVYTRNNSDASVRMFIPSFFAADVHTHCAPKDSIKSQMFPENGLTLTHRYTIIVS